MFLVPPTRKSTYRQYKVMHNAGILCIKSGLPMICVAIFSLFTMKTHFVPSAFIMRVCVCNVYGGAMLPTVCAVCCVPYSRLKCHRFENRYTLHALVPYSHRKHNEHRPAYGERMVPEKPLPSFRNICEFEN